MPDMLKIYQRESKSIEFPRDIKGYLFLDDGLKIKIQH